MGKKTRPINRKTENKTVKHMREKQGASNINERLEEVLKAELSVLLECGAQDVDLSIQPAIPEAGQDARYFIGVYEQKKEYILGRLEERLGLRRYWIRQYLSIIDARIRTALAQAEEEGFNPFTGETTGFTVIPYVNARYFLPKPEPKKRGRKANKPKRGKRRPVVIVQDGKATEYPSIEEANRKTGLGRRFIQHHSMKAYKENSL